MSAAHGFAQGRTSTGSGAWRTPPDVLSDLRRISGWGEWALDLAATSVDRVVPEYVGPDHPEPSRRDALALTSRQLDHLVAPDSAPIWCNPPYDQWAAFARVLTAAARDRHVPLRSCLLVFARTDTVAWHDAAPLASAIAFRKGRVSFVDTATGEPGGTAPAPSAALFFGPLGHSLRSGAYDAAARWLVVRP